MISSPLKIGILGASGKMGQRLIALLDADPATEAVYCIPRNPIQVFREADVVVDFTMPSAVLDHLAEALSQRKPFLIGVTGLDANQMAAIEKASAEIPLLYTPNTSFGVSLLSKLVTLAAQALDISYDVEIFESHHRHKADAPSGTALLLGEAAARGRGVCLEEVAVKGRTPESGKRVPGDIGFVIQRGGAQSFEHTVRFMGDEEEITLSHKGFSRDLFVKGAIQAAKWLKDQPKGFYTSFR